MAHVRTSVACVLLGMAFLSTGNSQSQSQQPFILLGGLNVVLGADQEKTLRQLGAVYDLRHMDNVPGNWSVMRKGGPPYDLVGVVSFGNDKVVAVSRSWGPKGQSASDIARALHDAVRTVYKDQRDSCSLTTSEVGTVGVETVVQCGRHRLTVFGSTDKDTSSGINESISAAY